MFKDDGKKKKKRNLRQKEKKKAKRFKSMHPKFIDHLNLSSEQANNPKYLLKVSLQTLSNTPETKSLLSCSEMQRYEVVPTLHNLNRNTTEIISSKHIINNLEKV